MNKLTKHNIQYLLLSFILLITFSLKKKFLVLTEIWPAYSDQIYGTWRETKGFKRLGKKDPTCHESDRSIQKQGIGLVKPADDGGMCAVHGQHGVDLKVLSCKATAVVATKLQRHYAPNLILIFLLKNY